MRTNVLYFLSFVYIFISTTSITSLGVDSDSLDINSVSWAGYLMTSISILLTFNLLINPKIKDIVLRNKILFFLIILFIISCLWSDNRWVALKKFIKFLGIVLSLVTLMINNKQNFWKALITYTILACTLSLFLIIIFPKLGLMLYDDGSFLPRGVFVHKNQLGIFCALGVLICFYSYKFKKSAYLIIIFCLCLILLMSSKSATAIIALCCSLLFYVLIRSIKNRPWLMMSYICLFLFFEIINNSFWVTNIFESILISLGKDATFTGRNIIWAGLIKIGMQQPVFGFGYGSFFRGDETLWVTNTIGWAAFHAHNGLLQIFLETGFVGLIIVLIFIVDLIKRIIQSKDILKLSFIPIIIVYNFSESGLLNRNFMSTFIVGLYLYLMLEKKYEFK